MVLMIGFMAMRTGYLKSSLRSGKALGARGHDVLLSQLVEQIAAHHADQARRARHADDDHREPDTLQ